MLLALVWDPTSASSQVLWRLGIPREPVVARLEELGGPVPAAPLPVQREYERGEKVWFERDQTSAVVTFLRERLGTEVWWGFNYEGERAYANADAEVDLEALVSEALVTSES